MSSFNDATFRSQQLLAPYQMQGAMNKTQGIANIGNAAMQAAGMWNQAQNSAAEMAIRQTESDARIASFQQEQQLNQYKMQQMLALDQAAMSRHGVTMAEMQADMSVMARDESREKLKAMRGKSDEQDQQNRVMMLEAEIATGMRFDPNTGKNVAIDPKEMESMKQRYGSYQKMRHPVQGETSLTRYTQMNLQYDRARRAASNLMGEKSMKDAAIREMQSIYPALREAARGVGIELPENSGDYADTLGKTDSYQDKQPAPDEPKKPRKGIAIRSLDNDTFGYIANNAYQSEQWQADPMWSKLNVDDETRAIMSNGIAAYADALITTQKKNGRTIDPQMAHEFIMQSARQSPDAMAFLLMLTQDSSDDIRMKLKVLFPEMNDSRLSVVMQRVNEQIDSLAGDK